MAESGHSVGTRTLRGMAWAYGAYVGGRLLVLVSTAILARILTPEDFGVVALALVFMTFLDTIKDLGLGQALIVASPEEEASRAQTVFGWSVVLGGGLALITAAIAPLAALFFHQSQLTGLLPVLGFTFLLRALGSTHMALARKRLHYRLLTISEVTEVVVRGAVGIGLALAGLGAWSLVLGFVAGVACNSAALWLLVDFRPRLRVVHEHLRDLLTFGGMLTAVDIGAAISYNMDYLFVGRILGATQLGLYSIGYRLPELMILNLAIVAGDVLFPAYSAIDREKLQRAFLLSLRYTAMLTFPIAAGLIVMAGPVIRVAFGDQWGGSVAVMQVLAAYSLVVAMSIPAGTIFKVTRSAWILVAVTIPHVIVLAIALAFLTKDGIVTVAACMAISQAVTMSVMGIIAIRRLEVSVLDTIRAVAAPAIAGAAVALALTPIERLVDEPALALVLGVPVALAVYLGLLLLLARDALRSLRDMAFPQLAAR